MQLFLIIGVLICTFILFFSKYPQDLNPSQIEEALPEIQSSFDDFSKIETLEKKQKNLQRILEYNYLTVNQAN